MTRQQIAKKIVEITGTKAEIELVKGEGYWYFVYNTATVYECASEYVMYMNAYSDQRWIEIGVSFVKEVEAK